MKIIDILNDIANRNDVPLKIKWRDKDWKYDNRNQDYYSDDEYSLFGNLAYIRTLDFITDEVEIIDELKDSDD